MAEQAVVKRGAGVGGAAGPRLLSCHDCGLLLRVAPLPESGHAKCPRCGAEVLGARANSIERTLGLLIAGLILFVVTQVFPFMSFKMEGREEISHLATGALQLWRQGFSELGALVFFASILAPLLKLLSLLAVLWPLQHGWRPPYLARLFRFAEVLHPWAMMEVYLLGVFVAYVKLIDLATIEIGLGLFSFAALIVVMIAADWVLQPDAVWERIAPADRWQPPPAGAAPIGCHACGLVLAGGDGERGAHRRCPRCGAALHRRKPDSLARTAALVLTAAILYIPANAFPVMTVISFGHGEPDTILSGVRVLIEENMWPLALLVFFASITVPVLKLVGLSYLMLSVRRRSRWRLRDRTVLYRVIEGVGRWSMIDVFMISILVALVRLGSIATIEPGVGAVSFAAVVIMTMIASEMFDPRLMWDAAEKSDARSGT
jgi:paraquat-inducible protein A